jgi:hypothetical protein
MDGGRASLLQRRVDETGQDADALDDSAGDTRGTDVADTELTNELSDFPPFDGTLPSRKGSEAGTVYPHGSSVTPHERSQCVVVRERDPKEFRIPSWLPAFLSTRALIVKEYPNLSSESA